MLLFFINHCFPLILFQRDLGRLLHFDLQSPLAGPQRGLGVLFRFHRFFGLGRGRILQLDVDLSLQAVLLIVLAHGSERFGRLFILYMSLAQSPIIFLSFLDVAFPQLLLLLASGRIYLSQLVVGGVGIVYQVFQHLVQFLGFVLLRGTF